MEFNIFYYTQHCKFYTWTRITSFHFINQFEIWVGDLLDQNRNAFSGQARIILIHVENNHTPSREQSRVKFENEISIHKSQLLWVQMIQLNEFFDFNSRPINYMVCFFFFSKINSARCVLLREPHIPQIHPMSLYIIFFMLFFFVVVVFLISVPVVANRWTK